MSESFLSAAMDGLVCVERRFDAFVEVVRVGSGDAVDGDEWYCAGVARTILSSCLTRVRHVRCTDHRWIDRCAALETRQAVGSKISQRTVRRNCLLRWRCWCPLEPLARSGKFHLFDKFVEMATATWDGIIFCPSPCGKRELYPPIISTDIVRLALLHSIGAIV